MTSASHTPETRRILVVANGIVEASALRDAAGLRAGEERHTQLYVIAPALNSRLRHWLSDEDGARGRAGLRLEVSLETLCAAGIEADGQVGDADPLQAISDALFEFRAEEIVIAAQPGWRSHWATRDLVGRVRHRFAQPLMQVVAAPGESTEPRSAASTRRGAQGARRAAPAARSIASLLYPSSSLVCGRVKTNG
jgi:hypothetical protein